MIYLLSFNFIVLLVLWLFWKRHTTKIDETYLQKRKIKLDGEIADKIQQQQNLENSIQEQKFIVEVLELRLKDLETQKIWLDKEIEEYSISRHQFVDEQIIVYENEEKRKIDLNLIQEKEQKIKIIEEQHKAFLLTLQEEQTNKQNELMVLIRQIDNYRAKQEAISQEILRRRELEEQTDFYRVCLPDEAIADVALLQATRQNLKKPEIIDKIIYDTYIAKPVLEMIKRVLQNTTCSGIYKITCQQTKEIYIGKSTDIKNRWQQHCKTAFNCGTIASSVLHRKMQQYGIENFTFELLEKVPKDKLSEREAFYIDFYQSKKVGLNERRG